MPLAVLSGLGPKIYILIDVETVAPIYQLFPMISPGRKVSSIFFTSYQVEARKPKLKFSSSAMVPQYVPILTTKTFAIWSSRLGNLRFARLLEKPSLRVYRKERLLDHPASQYSPPITVSGINFIKIYQWLREHVHTFRPLPYNPGTYFLLPRSGRHPHPNIPNVSGK